MTNPPCPYCGEELHLDPKRAATCRNCDQKVRVRGKQTLFDHHPLTEEEARAVDAFGTLENFRVTKEDFHAARSSLQEKFDGTPQVGDVIWRLWHVALEKNPSMAEQIYYSMALFLNKEGRDATHVRSQHAREQLKGYANSGFQKVEIIAAGNSCDACKKQGGRVLTVEQALKEMPLPHPDCSFTLNDPDRGFCRCIYTAVPSSLDYSSVAKSGGKTNATRSGCAGSLALALSIVSLCMLSAVLLL